jgi:hypothetical protein
MLLSKKDILETLQRADDVWVHCLDDARATPSFLVF